MHVDVDYAFLFLGMCATCYAIGVRRRVCVTFVFVCKVLALNAAIVYSIVIAADSSKNSSIIQK